VCRSIQKVINKGWLDVSEIIARIDEIMTKVTAYRKSVEQKTDLVKSTSSTYTYYRPPLYLGESPEAGEGEVTKKPEYKIVESVGVREIVKTTAESLPATIATETAYVEESTELTIAYDLLLYTEEWGFSRPPVRWELIYREEWSS